MLTKEDLRQLIEHQAEPAVSIYLPTGPTLPEAEQARIRYKNLLREVRENLHKLYTDREMEPVFAELERLSYEAFWNHQRRGLAVFASPGFLRYFKLGQQVPSLHVVADNFHTKPLIKILQMNRRFLVLALSEKRARLFEGDSEALVEKRAEEIPQNLQQAVGLWEQEPFRWGSFTATGMMPQASDLSKLWEAYKVEYIRAIDRELAKRLANDRIPLILACVEELYGLYRKNSEYPWLVEEGYVKGNPDHLSEEELHRKAWEIIEPLFRKRQEKLIEEFNSKLGTGLAGQGLREVAQAAAQGRVSDLLLKDGVRIWGVLDRSTGEVFIGEEEPNPVDADLLDEVAEVTLVKGGDVWVLGEESFPLNDYPVGAIYRW